MKIMRIGIDLAKTVFQVHGVDAQEKPVCRRQLRRSQLLECKSACKTFQVSGVIGIQLFPPRVV